MLGINYYYYYYGDGALTHYDAACTTMLPYVCYSLFGFENEKKEKICSLAAPCNINIPLWLVICFIKYDDYIIMIIIIPCMLLMSQLTTRSSHD